MKNTLKPTLWRTCRALMNPTRLRLFRIALEHGGELCVRDYARHLGLTDSVASIYLRQLNARGLLGVRRDRIKVFYNAENDRTLPDARGDGCFGSSARELGNGGCCNYLI